MVAASGTRPRPPGIRPARCSPSRAGSCMRRRSAAPPEWAVVTPEMLDRAARGRAHRRSVPTSSTQSEPITSQGTTDRGRGRSRRHRQDHHAASGCPRLDRCWLPGDRSEPHRGRRRRVTQRSRHARGNGRQVLPTGTTTQPPADGCSRRVTWSSSTRPACSPPETSTASSTSSGRQGAKLVLVGDHHQLGAIRAPGGMFAALAEHLGAIELHETHRFAHPWEAHALAQLRRGDPAGLEALVRRAVGFTEALNLEYSVTVSPAGGLPTRAGRDAIMLAHDHAAAHELAGQARAATRRRWRSATVTDPRGQSDVGTQTISVGDHVETRRNDRRLTYGPDAVGPQPRPLARRRRRPDARDPRGRAPPPPCPHHPAGRLRRPARPPRVRDHDRRLRKASLSTRPTSSSPRACIAASCTPRSAAVAKRTTPTRSATSDTELAHGQAGRPATPLEVLARVAQRERPDWAAHDVLRCSMTPRQAPRRDPSPDARSHANHATNTRRTRPRCARRLPRPARGGRPRHGTGTDTGYQDASTGAHAITARAGADDRTLTAGVAGSGAHQRRLRGDAEPRWQFGPGQSLHHSTVTNGCGREGSSTAIRVVLYPYCARVRVTPFTVAVTRRAT